MISPLCVGVHTSSACEFNVYNISRSGLGSVGRSIVVISYSLPTKYCLAGTELFLFIINLGNYIVGVVFMRR